MSRAVSNGTIEDEVRSGWSTKCLRCGKPVRYTVLNIVGGREPFLYCDRSSDFVLRDEDAEIVAKLAAERELTVDDLGQVYDSLERELEPCPAGGRFGRWQTFAARTATSNFHVRGECSRRQPGTSRVR